MMSCVLASSGPDRLLGEVEKLAQIGGDLSLAIEFGEAAEELDPGGVALVSLVSLFRVIRHQPAIGANEPAVDLSLIHIW